jgi:hypothetical protein
MGQSDYLLDDDPSVTTGALLLGFIAELNKSQQKRSFCEMENIRTVAHHEEMVNIRTSPR